MRKAAISNWTFGSKPAVRSFLTAVGYSENYNRLLDNGGTIFTDSLLGVKEIVTREEPDAMLYDTDTYIDNEYYIAKMKKAFPFGIVTAGDSIKDLEIDIIDSFANINLLYQRLTGSQEILIKSYELVDCQVEELEGYSLFHYSMDIDVNKESMLYVQIPDQNQRYMIYLNDEVMTLPALENESNQFFPDYFVTGLVSCGAHKEETVKVDIVCASEPETFASVGVLNLGLMYEAVDVQNKYGREVDAGKNNLHYNIDVDKDDQYLMIPISYDGGYRVVRNGVTIEAETAINGAFIYIPLVRGTNDIEIKFYPTGLFAGCLISLGGALLAVLYIVFARKLDKCKYINSFAYYSFWICTAGMFAYIYVWQFFKTIVLYAKVFKYLYSL
ncbi:MAG: YfhO family protein [Acetatifactor sp.]|nr:YfhO family protein [Acetatifactor sp.]